MHHQKFAADKWPEQAIIVQNTCCPHWARHSTAQHGTACLPLCLPATGGGRDLDVVLIDAKGVLMPLWRVLMLWRGALMMIWLASWLTGWYGPIGSACQALCHAGPLPHLPQG